MVLTMHVAIFADFAVPSGGAQQVAILSANALAEQGIKVTYIHSIGEEQNSCLNHPLIDQVGLNFKDIWDQSLIKGLSQGLWNSRTTQTITKLFQTSDFKPDIIHIHQWTRSFSPSIFRIVMRQSCPVVVTAHDYFLGCPNGVYYRFDQQKPCTLKPLSASCLVAQCDPQSYAHKAVRVARLIITKNLIDNGALNIIHVSDQGLHTLKPWLPLNIRHHRIDNPVALEKATSALLPSNGAFVYVGRLTREKGAHLVALAGAKAQVPVMFIGEGPLHKEIETIYPQAKMMGWCSREKTYNILKSETLALVAPSLWNETGPLTVYEALGLGLPVIVSSRAGASEKVSHGNTGMIIEPNIQSLHQAFIAMQKDHQAKVMGTEAYNRYWMKPLSLENHAQHLIKLYESLLD